MLRWNLYAGLVLLFGWLGVDAIVSLLGNPLEGVYYPLASGRLKSMPHDWTQKSAFGAPLYFAVFAATWFFFVRREGPRRGSRLASLVTTFVLAPFWIVSVLSADLYGLDVNAWWAASMAYANISFLLYGFVGDGDPGALRF
jgi:hypothetical protein